MLPYYAAVIGQFTGLACLAVHLYRMGS